FANLFLAKIFGFFGISTGFILTLCILCSKKSFGVPFMTPFTPISENILKDTIIMKPYAANKQETSEID
ncbi:MAG: spore germination protein, partial [Clostridia bacterium]|nr:spore germination protein [Clostridia bacterium]